MVDMGSDGVVPVRLVARGAAALPGGGGGAMVMGENWTGTTSTVGINRWKQR
jgi:hypothetical protein